MISSKKLLQLLKTEQATLASEALARPSGRDAFEYGRVSGMHAGLERAQEVLLGMLSDEAEQGRNL